MSEYTKEEHQKVAESMPRDSEGHFIPKPHSQTPPTTPHENPLEGFIHHNTSVTKTHDDSTLLDVHVGNPLRRITQILEEIKRQKAFSFTLKGSLGIMGVALALGTFGIFGGTKALCDKGVQTKMGAIQQLTYQEEEAVSILNDIPILNMLFKKPTTNRTVLIAPNSEIIHLVLKKYVTLPTTYSLPTTTYLATGSFDSCSLTLTVNDPSALQQAQ